MSDGKEQATDNAPAEEAVEAAEAVTEAVSAEETAATEEVEAAPEGETDAAARIAELEAEVAAMKDQALRAMAEAQNVRRRAEKETADASKYAIASFAREMIVVADNLRRALDAIDTDVRKADEAVENLAVGVEMTEKEMLSAFERAGIQQIDALEKRFDHNFHEALFEIPDESKPAGTVMQVIETGYVLKDRLLRPAKVGVSKGGPKEAPAPAEEAATDKPDADGAQQAYGEKNAASGGNLNEEL